MKTPEILTKYSSKIRNYASKAPRIAAALTIGSSLALSSAREVTSNTLPQVQIPLPTAEPSSTVLPCIDGIAPLPNLSGEKPSLEDQERLMNHAVTMLKPALLANTRCYASVDASKGEVPTFDGSTINVQNATLYEMGIKNVATQRETVIYEVRGNNGEVISKAALIDAPGPSILTQEAAQEKAIEYVNVAADITWRLTIASNNSTPTWQAISQSERSITTVGSGFVSQEHLP